jgi:hypothetical protein
MRIPNLLVGVAFLITIGLSTIAQAAPAGPRPASRPVPEIDPASAAGALAMLAGGVLMIRARRR